MNSDPIYVEENVYRKGKYCEKKNSSLAFSCFCKSFWHDNELYLPNGDWKSSVESSCRDRDKTRKASNQIQFRLQIDVLKVNCLQCELERIFINLVGVKQADFIWAVQFVQVSVAWQWSMLVRDFMKTRNKTISS